MKILQFFSSLQNRPALLMVALLAVDVALVLVHGMVNSVDISTRHLDGAYQTASALFRLADGQWPGKDFFPYLGVGLTFTLYPIFLLAGGDVAASIFSAHFLVAAASAFSIGLLASLIFKRQRLLSGVVTASVFLVLALSIDSPWLAERFSPGHSLRPLRSFLPYLAAVLVYFLVQSRLQPIAIYGAIGGIAGATFLWSNDYGLPTLVLLIIVGIFFAYRSGNLRAKVLLSMVGCALLAGSAGLMFATKGHAVDLMRYNFVDVRVDQYWYFCCWNPEIRIFTISEIFSKFLFSEYCIGWWGSVWFALLAVTYNRPTAENILLLFIGLVLFCGGAIASIGGHLDPGYMAAFIFWCQSVTLIFSLYVLSRFAHLVAVKFSSTSGRLWLDISDRTFHLLGLLVLVIASGVLLRSVIQYQSYVETARADQSRFYVKELGGYLPTAWLNHVEMARSMKDANVIEEYWGIWGGVTHNKSGLPVDSVIHALGSTREKFKTQMLELPDHVITSSQQVSGLWFGWNLSANWWFYKTLLQNYEYQQTSPSTYFWSKRSEADVWPSVGCHIENDATGRGVVIEADHVGYYEVTLARSGTQVLNSRSLLLVKNNLNYAFIDGYVSINPHAQEQSFPVRLWNPRQHLDFKLLGAVDSSSDIPFDTCQAREVVTDLKNFLPALSDVADSAFDLTDPNWVNGVAKGWATAFFISNTSENISQFSIGRKVKFKDGTVRAIFKQEPSGVYLNIFLEGTPLDGSVVGYPHKLQVID
jgi:hypothetical protein